MGKMHSISSYKCDTLSSETRRTAYQIYDAGSYTRRPIKPISTIQHCVILCCSNNFLIVHIPTVITTEVTWITLTEIPTSLVNKDQNTDPTSCYLVYSHSIELQHIIRSRCSVNKVFVDERILLVHILIRIKCSSGVSYALFVHQTYRK
jgi:hypothetical protein